jgi:hypothetical protein
MTRRIAMLVAAIVCATGPATAAAAGPRPSVTGFSFSPSTFVVAAPGKRSTSIRFRLSRPAKVRVAMAREFAGGHRVFRGALTRQGRRGRVTIAFSGTLRGQTLKPGTYRATIVATDSRRRASRSRTARFKVAAGSEGAPPSSAAPPPGASPTPAPQGGFPTPTTTGVPAGWVPAQTRTSDLHVTQPGAVVEDILLENASIVVEAPNVTIRRVRLQGGKITNFNGNPCQGGMVIEDASLEPAPGQDSSIETEGVIEAAGYTARRVRIWRRAEGFRASEDCGPVRIEDSFAKIVIPDGRCDLHSDGIQGYGAPWTTVVNTTIDFNEASCGTAPFFVPKNQGNTGATVDRLLVMGGGYPFRLGVPGTVSGLKIVNRSWVFGPIDVACSLVSAWDASIVTITSDYQVDRAVRAQPCNTESGN